MLTKLFGRGHVFEDGNGNVAAAGGTLQVFINTTLTPHPTLYSDDLAQVKLGYQFGIGGDGRLANDIFADGPVRVRLLDVTGAAVYTEDNVRGPGESTGEATGNNVKSRFLFREAASQPATPVGDAPAGWLEAPPVSPTDSVWVVIADVISGTNEVIGSWSEPAVFSNPPLAGSADYRIEQVGHGGIMHNSVGTLTYRARRRDSSGDNPLVTGAIQIYVDGVLGTQANGFQPGSDGYTVVLAAANLPGGIALLELRDGGPAGAVLATSGAVNNVDGSAAIDVRILTPEGVTFKRDHNGWNDLVKQYPIDVYQSGALINEPDAQVQVSVDPNTGLLTGQIVNGDLDLDITFPNDNSSAVTIDVQYIPSGDRQSVTVQSVQDGAAGADALLRYLTIDGPLTWTRAPNGGAWEPAAPLQTNITFTLEDTVLGILEQAQQRVILDPNTGLFSTQTIVNNPAVAASVQGLGTGSITLTFTNGGIQTSIGLSAPQGGSQGVTAGGGENFLWSVYDDGTGPIQSPAGNVQDGEAEFTDGGVTFTRIVRGTLNPGAGTIAVTSPSGDADTTMDAPVGNNSDYVTVQVRYKGNSPVRFSWRYSDIDFSGGGGK